MERLDSEVRSSAVDSPLGRWRMCEWYPVRWRGLVARVWDFEGAMALPRERVFPDGQVDIILQLDEPHRVIEPGGARRCPVACVGGLQTAAFVVEAPPRPVRVLGIRLHPAGAYAVLGGPLHGLAGETTVDLRDLAGPEAGELVARCQEASSAAGRLRQVERWLGERLARGPAADPAVAWAAGEIARRRGAVPIGELRERTGLARTTLAERFRSQVGVSPKVLARIHRFRHALELLTGPTAPLAEVALAAGYYDQPHFNAEFRTLAGLTPGEFLRAPRFEGSPNLAEAA